MVDKPKTDQDLSFRNVELHSLGRREYGSLVLTKHHFVFRYYPDAKRASGSGSRSQNGSAAGPKSVSISTESSTLTEASAGSTQLEHANGTQVSDDAAGSRSATDPPASNLDARNSKDARPKQRQKEMWMPYPMVNHCILRPSHSITQSVRFEGGGDTHLEHGDDDGELFPPTYGTSSYERPSTDSARLGPYNSPARSASPAVPGLDVPALSETGRSPAIRIRLKDFRMMALHFRSASSGTSADDIAREVFYSLRSRCCVDSIREFHAFRFSPPKEETTVNSLVYDARREYARMGVGEKVANGPGAAWRISDINKDYSYSATYPSVLCVPATVSDNMLKYGGIFRSRSRIPCLSYLHPNGGSITRSSQPMVGVQNKRNPQDERLVSAIFSSHTPPLRPSQSALLQQEPLPDPVPRASSDSFALDSGSSSIPISQSDTAVNEISDEKSTPARPKVYGSTRRNLIVDARPKINALANRATGGGIEDVANYRGTSDIPVEKVFLNVANIHVMRASLEKVVESFANSDYIKVKPDQEALRKSGWLGHIAGILDGAEMIARVVGLGGSHVLIHCSDGWDRTAQMSALAQVMLDPHTRTFNGFITLIQKEFLSFGHKFRDRDGIEGSEKWFEIENERVAPPRNRESHGADPTSLNTLGTKALAGAKNWFEKNRGNIFRQQNSSGDNVSDQSSSRPPSPPLNPLVHSSPSSTGKEEKVHRMSEKEVSPVFHQFLDAVYQLLYQRPNAFEFNEHFLCRLFYHVYSCQYGEFLFNTERERVQDANLVGSVWSHFLSRRQDFINAEYMAQVDDPLLFPNRSGFDKEIDVRWWHKLFRRDDGEMNVSRALVRPEHSGATYDAISNGSLKEQAFSGAAEVDPTPATNGGIKESKSTPNLAHVESSLAGGISSPDVAHHGSETTAAPLSTVARDDRNAQIQGLQEEEEEDVTPSKDSKGTAESAMLHEPVAVEYEGDPLGVTANIPKKMERMNLDFAAFASQTAFRDR